MSESKVTQKNEVVQLHEQTLKQCLDPSPTPKIARQGPKKSKMTPKLSQNQMSELKETKKMKVVQLHDQTQKQLGNTITTPKLACQGPESFNVFSSRFFEFSFFLSILTFDFDSILGPFFTFWGPNGIFLGLGQASKTVQGSSHLD